MAREVTFLPGFICGSWILENDGDFRLPLGLALGSPIFPWSCEGKLGVLLEVICLLRNLYAGQEATVRTGNGTTDWFQIGKGVCQGYKLSLCLFNLYIDYIMKNAGLEEAQAGIKIAGRNINNLRYVHDTTLMAESEEELKSLLMKVKVEIGRAHV